MAQSVRVVDSRTADRKQVTPTKGAAAQVSTVVVEVGEGSNAAAAGVKEGDKIRCSASGCSHDPARRLHFLSATTRERPEALDHKAVEMGGAASPLARP